MKSKLLLTILLFITSNSYSQKTFVRFPASFGPIVGYQGFSNMIEIGVGRGLKGSVAAFNINAPKRFKKPYISYYATYHFNPFEKIHGGSLGFSSSTGIVFGFDFNYYKTVVNVWGFRPSLGLALAGTEIVYRYNFRIAGEKITGITGHQIGIRYYLPLFIEFEGGYKFGKKYFTY
ncbi:MAG: hypothetical protein HOA61_18140 [Bacteroidetes bacterium]|nr:hypothetical protein [Cytophagia bacterium]MBT6837957.1 hypothetical protein [Bacteroidota bacterium]MBT7828551.1 hypothetical protein [Bacteroidota bacterium]